MSRKISLAILLVIAIISSGFYLVGNVDKTEDTKLMTASMDVENIEEVEDIEIVEDVKDVSVAENEVLGIVSETISDTTEENLEEIVEDNSISPINVPPSVLDDTTYDYVAEQYSLRTYAAMAEDVYDINIAISEKEPTKEITHGKLTFIYDPNLKDVDKENLEARFNTYAPNDNYEKTLKGLAQTALGEAGGCSHTEIAAVIWNILNRYDAGYAKSIFGVLSAPNQYHGYNPSFQVRDDIEEICIDVIARWVAEKEGKENVGRVLPSDYLWFGGDGRHNHYRNEYKTSNRWDWSLSTPYID